MRRHDAGGDEDTAAGIDREGAQLNAAAIDMLDRFRLPGFGLDRKDRDIVLAAV